MSKFLLKTMWFLKKIEWNSLRSCEIVLKIAWNSRKSYVKCHNCCGLIARPFIRGFNIFNSLHSMGPRKLSAKWRCLSSKLFVIGGFTVLLTYNTNKLDNMSSHLSINLCFYPLATFFVMITYLLAKLLNKDANISLSISCYRKDNFQLIAKFKF